MNWTWFLVCFSLFVVQCCSSWPFWPSSWCSWVCSLCLLDFALGGLVQVGGRAVRRCSAQEGWSRYRWGFWPALESLSPGWFYPQNLSTVAISVREVSETARPHWTWAVWARWCFHGPFSGSDGLVYRASILSPHLREPGPSGWSLPVIFLRDLCV